MASQSVGCAWQIRAMSSEDAENSFSQRLARLRTLNVSLAGGTGNEGLGNLKGQVCLSDLTDSCRNTLGLCHADRCAPLAAQFQWH